MTPHRRFQVEVCAAALAMILVAVVAEGERQPLVEVAQDQSMRYDPNPPVSLGHRVPLPSDIPTGGATITLSASGTTAPVFATTAPCSRPDGSTAYTSSSLPAFCMTSGNALNVTSSNGVLYSHSLPGTTVWGGP